MCAEPQQVDRDYWFLYRLLDFPGINLRRKLLHRADPSLQGFQPIYQSILFHLTLVADFPGEKNRD